MTIQVRGRRHVWPFVGSGLIMLAGACAVGGMAAQRSVDADFAGGDTGTHARPDYIGHSVLG